MTTITTDLVVQTTAGRVRGTRDGELLAWRGIPYAAAPVGDLRWRAPKPVEPWDDVRDATEFGPVPSQIRLREDIGAGKNTPMSEDCLTINVLRPEAETDAPRPVMVYIYGGAYSVGASSAPAYRGTGIAQGGDVVYVTFNYRLGALGYLDFTRYETADRPFDSNLGLRDQVLALQWVRDNIAAFGGDPANVTLWGQSAGGNSVTTLLCTPAARGLFARAIALSSAPTSVYGKERTAGWASEFVGLLGGTDETAVETLTKATADELVAAANRLTNELGPEEQPGALSMCPVVDGTFLPKHPIDAFADGSAARVPLIIGTTSNEGSFFKRLLKVLPTTSARMQRMFQLTDPGAESRVLAAYSGRDVPTEVAGDLVFWEPSVRVAEAQSAQAPTWSYRFDYSTRMLRLMGLGATHGMDMPLVFGDLRSGLGGLAQLLGGRATSQAVSARQQAWIFQFAKDGTVDASWPRYDATDRKTRIIDATDRIESDPRGERRKAWAGFNTYR
jgi:para-nitrobenzyl esterase